MKTEKLACWRQGLIDVKKSYSAKSANAALAINGEITLLKRYIITDVCEFFW